MHDNNHASRLMIAQEWEDALDDIPKLVVASSAASGVLRRTLAQQLPRFPVQQLLQLQRDGLGAHEAGQQLWRAYLLLSFVAHVSHEPAPGSARDPGRSPNPACGAPWRRQAALARRPPPPARHPQPPCV
jgi:hypothetical protein